MKPWKKLIFVACIVVFAGAAFGCSEEGPAEKAGKQIDQATEKAADAAKKLFD